MYVSVCVCDMISLFHLPSPCHTVSHRFRLSCSFSFFLFCVLGIRFPCPSIIFFSPFLHEATLKASTLISTVLPYPTPHSTQPTHTHTHRVIFMHHNSLNTFKRKNKKRHRVRASFYFSRSTMCYIFPDQSINVYKDSMITLMACWGMLLEGIFYLIMHIILYIGL